MTATSGAGGSIVGSGGTGSGGSGGGGGGVPIGDADAAARPDAGADAKIDARDAGTGPDARDGGSSPACAFVDTLDRLCSVDGDCAVGIHQTDCCGNTFAIGFNKTERTKFDSSEPTCDASYPGCGRPQGPTRTDSGETASETMTIHVGCIASGPTKACRTYVTMRPADAP